MNNPLPQITRLALSLSKQLQEHLLSTEAAILRDANFWAAQKEHEGHLVFVLVMVADRDAKNQGVTRVLRAELPIARPMVEGRDASTWVALKALRGKRIIA